MSLIKYKEEVIPEKIIAANVVSKKSRGRKSLPEKTKGAYRLKFLTHCLGLAVLRRLKKSSAIKENQ